MRNFFIILISFFKAYKVLKEEYLNKTINLKMDKNNFQQITFGGGCFWCLESCFNILKGVESAISGYSGGH